MKSNNIYLGFLVFIFAILISAIAYLEVRKSEPILYRSKAVESDKYYVDLFIQNPFRDKTKENVADSFFDSIKDKEISESFIDRKYMFNSYRGCGEGKLVSWKLWNRFDGENDTEFYYAIYTRIEPTKGKNLLSWAMIKLTREDSEWNVKGFTCMGTSINDW